MKNNFTVLFALLTCSTLTYSAQKPEPLTRQELTEQLHVLTTAVGEHKQIILALQNMPKPSDEFANLEIQLQVLRERITLHDDFFKEMNDPENGLLVQVGLQAINLERIKDTIAKLTSTRPEAGEEPSPLAKVVQQNEAILAIIALHQTSIKNIHETVAKLQANDEQRKTAQAQRNQRYKQLGILALVATAGAGTYYGATRTEAGQNATHAVAHSAQRAWSLVCNPLTAIFGSSTAVIAPTLTGLLSDEPTSEPEQPSEENPLIEPFNPQELIEPAHSEIPAFEPLEEILPVEIVNFDLSNETSTPPSDAA